MQLLGCGLAVVTNQSGLARGYFDHATLDAIHTRLRELLAAHRVILDGIYCCPHHPDDACSCRKPLPGLVEQAVAAHGFDPREAFVVGDKACDLDLGRAVGATTILVRTGYGAETQRTEAAAAADFVVDDLAGAALVVGERLHGTGPGARIPVAAAAPHGGTGR
jgi:D-glycero-D-manno-heptose 1,7-bisphosphate phosphatase